MLIGASFPFFADLDGSPLNAGYIYIGVANQNPETSPVSVYFDDAMTIPAPQPLRTLNGIIVSNGTPANIYTATSYSITVRNKNSILCYSLPNSEDFDTTSYLQTLLASSTGSNNVGTPNPLAPAYLKTVSDILNGDQVSIYRFLSNAMIADAQASGFSVDMTSRMSEAQNTGVQIYYPRGGYYFSSLSFGAGGINGDGGETVLKSSDTGTANLITYTGNFATQDDYPSFRDFRIIGDLSKSAGAGIKIAPASGEASYLQFRGVVIQGTPIGIDFVKASLWKVIGCDFLSYSAAGIQVANTNAPDSGDSVIANCVFNTPINTGSGIWQKSSGGLKVVGNKFLGGLRGYTMNLEGSTSVLLITGNSFENMAGTDIVFAQGVAAQNFVNAAITGNEFSVGDVAIATDASGFLSELVISGNNINMGAAGSNACIALNSVTDFYVGSNIIKGNGGAGSSAINVTSCTNGKIGANTYANLPTPLVVTTSPTVDYELNSQSGSSTTSAAGYGGYGTLFVSAPTNVTFPRAFLMTPSITDLTIQPGSSNGSVGGIVTAISKTGFTYIAITCVTGIASTIYWKCKGIL